MGKVFLSGFFPESSRLDPADCNKGFEYLYLLKQDYEKLPAGTVEAHKVEEINMNQILKDWAQADVSKSWKSLKNLFESVLNAFPSHFSQVFQFMVLKSLFCSWFLCFSDDLCIKRAFFCQEAGEERYVLDAIIGEGMKSTEGGIGVENLQGSGLIAGETSRAYQDSLHGSIARDSVAETIEAWLFFTFLYSLVDLANLCQFIIPYA